MNEVFTVTLTDALVIVDVQNDFVSGSVAIPGAHEIIPVINGVAAHFEKVVFTQDWHPPEHISFASRHRAQPGDTALTSYGDQSLFADHCVQGEWGGELDEGLDLTKMVLKLYKGHRLDVDSFSAFTENDRTTSTGLANELIGLDVRRVFFAGLSLYGCVRHSALDAIRAGFEAVIILDACRARPSSMDLRHHEELYRSGVSLISASDILGQK